MILLESVVKVVRIIHMSKCFSDYLISLLSFF